MSTSKHIDKICIAVLSVVILITFIFMKMGNPDASSSGKTFGYEKRLFNTDIVHTIDIVMNDWDSFIETCENEEYSVCTVVIDGEKCGNIGIRAKGNTSLSSVSAMGSQRYSFKLEFDQYEKGKSYYGLDKLCLNNLIQDNTMMKDYLVYQMMDEFGVETPLCSYAYITINGEDWGLYLAVEGVEDSFLARNYGSDSGEMYKPDSLSFGGGRGNGMEFDINDFDFSALQGDSSSEDTTPSESSETSDDSSTEETPAQGSETSSGNGFGGFAGFGGGNMQPPADGNFDFSNVDFSEMANAFGGGDMQPPTDGNFDISNVFSGFGMGSSDVKLQYIDDDPASYSNIFDNAKTDITETDKERLISSLKDLNEYTNLENVVNIEEVIRYFVIHSFVCNDDSYTGAMIHNYYLHEKDGKLSMIPWDYNLGFGTFMGGQATSTINGSIDSPVNGGNVDDRPMLGWIFSDEQYTEQYHELFASFISEWLDSGKLTQMVEDTANLIRPYVEKDPTKFCTSEEFEAGITVLSQFVVLRGEAVSRQLAGDTTQVDASDLNLSDMGTMNSSGGMGGGMSFPGGDMPDFSNMGGNFDGNNMPDFSNMGGNFDGNNMPDFSNMGGTPPDFGNFTQPESEQVPE